ncbi:hypothetical protein KC460_04500 [Candidatus Dependentiae bacterium]|nr:hypothetical protein [Candidatus Dependentiae bacterium]
MKIVKYIILIACIPTIIIGYCKQKDKKHRDKNIVRCLYTQEDIKKIKEKDCERHKEIGREKECFYCGCPIETHIK